MAMAHFGSKYCAPVLPYGNVRRAFVLDFEPNCTHVQKSAIFHELTSIFQYYV